MISDHQSLRDLAARRKWQFKPDDNYPVPAIAGIGGVVNFPIDFLRQMGKNEQLVGSV